MNMNGPIAWMAKNSVAANLGMFVLFIAGAIGLLTARQEVFPEFDLDVVGVNVVYPGASPEEVEQGITLAVEEAVRGLDGVKRVTSTSSEGNASIRIELLRGTNPESVAADVKSEVDGIQSFPEEAEEPTVAVASRRSTVLSLVIAGEQPLSTLHAIAETARADLLRKDGITQVELQGVRPLEVSIEVSRENLESYGLTLDEVAGQVRRASLELPGGTVDTRAGEILVRVSDRKLTREQFEQIIIRGVGAGEVRLGDIARVIDGYADTDQESYYNGRRAVRVSAYRVGDESPIDIAETVRAYMADLQKELPPNIELAIWNDESQLLRQRIDLLVRNARGGLILVLIVLALFLKPRLAGWVALGIPISFLGAFALIGPLDLSLNMITLFGFIVTLGMVVDDAIVVGENIYTKAQTGMGHLEAAVAGAREMATPVTFSILTTVAAFGPLLFVPGPIGKIFRLIPLVVISVLIFSLLESFFVLPAHLGHKPSAFFQRVFAPLERIQGPVSAWLDRFTAQSYQPVVRLFIRHRYVALSSAVGIFLVTMSLVVSGFVPFSFLPKLEGDLVVASARLPYGAPLENTLEVRKAIESSLNRTIERMGGPAYIKGVFTRVGEGPQARGPGAGAAASGSHLVTLEVNMVSSEHRDFSAQDFGDTWNSELPKLPGIEALTVQSNFGPGGNALDVQISHPDTQVLAEVASRLQSALGDYDGLVNIENDYAAGKPQLDFELLAQARTLNITANDVAQQIRSAFFGSEALREQRGRNELKVYVRLPEEQRQSLADVSKTLIRSPGGGFVPLGLVAGFERGRAPTKIDREDGQRIVNVKADLGPSLASPREIIASLESEFFPQLRDEYRGLEIELVGEQRQQGESFSSLGRNFLVAIFVIYTLLAIPFKSYVQPFIVMSAIPFGMVGAVGGHMLMGYGLSVISMFGVIALSGVVVNDSLVLVAAINDYRRGGMNVVDAVASGGMRRLRPILLTSLTTFFGLAPMILETSVQARFLIPMALSLGFGILFATVIIVLLVPALYMMVEDARGLFGSTTEFSRGGGDIKPMPAAREL
ncbi:MAG: efflux RND transporter permease subunit [Myxococcota bacterium]